MKLAKTRENYWCEILLQRLRVKYSVVQLSKLMDVSRSEIYRLCERGRINLSEESYQKIVAFASEHFPKNDIEKIKLFWEQTWSDSVEKPKPKVELVSAKTLMDLADEGLSIGAASRRLKVCSEAHLARIIRQFNDPELLGKFRRNAIEILRRSRPAARRYA